MTESLVVRRHPNGGYAVVRTDTDAPQIQPVDPIYHDQYGTLSIASKAAYEEATAFEGLGCCGYSVHPECFTD